MKLISSAAGESKRGCASNASLLSTCRLSSQESGPVTKGGKQILWNSLAVMLATQLSMLRFLLEGCGSQRLTTSGERHRVLFFGKTTHTETAVVEVIRNERNLFSQMELPIDNQSAGERKNRSFFVLRPVGIWSGKILLSWAVLYTRREKTGSCCQRAFQCHEHFAP